MIFSPLPFALNQPNQIFFEWSEKHRDGTLDNFISLLIMVFLTPVLQYYDNVILGLYL